MKLEFLSDISKLGDRFSNTSKSHTLWNALNPTGNPFCSYEFLQALEASGCCSAETGWQPQHIVIRNEGDECIATIPSYFKTHSNGEYVFDWAWADAYHRNGLEYYPKLLSAIPFTPSVGPRILTKDAHPSRELLAFIRDNTIEQLQRRSVSSWHLLFPDHQGRLIETPSLSRVNPGEQQANALLIRQGTQFQWLNRDYHNFDDFLNQLTSRKRKSIRKERQKVAKAGVQCQILDGSEIDESALENFYLCYQLTYLKRGQRPYLNRVFFQQILATMPNQIKLILASYRNKVVAASLFFNNSSTLFGRYWGCTDEFSQLHFECCYYQGIDYAITQKMQRFDAGAQGEHKIQRGFEPTPTYSLHWIRHTGFRAAIANFVSEEQVGMAAYAQDAANYLPFKKTSE